MKFKQIISAVLSSCMLLTCTMPALAAKENFAKDSDKPKYTFSVVAEKNDNLMAEMLKSYANTYERTTESNNEITLNVNLNDDITYNEYNTLHITGTMDVNGGISGFSADGDVYVALTDDGKTGMYGTVTGYLGEEKSNENHLTLNIQYIPETSEIYAFASVGMVENGSDPCYIVYGEPVENLYSVIMAASERNNSVAYDKDATYEVEELSNESYSMNSRAANDYNTNYIGAVGSYGNGYQLTSLAFFSPLRMKTNSSYKMYTKVTASTANAFNYVRGAQILYGTTSVWLDKVYIHQGSTSDKEFEVSNLNPPQKTLATSISFGVPVWTTGFSLFNVSITLPRITTSTAKHSNSIMDNSAQWSFFAFPSQMEWQNGSCASTNGGVSGCTTITYYKNRTTDYNVGVVGRCEVTFGWQDVYGAQVRSGSFTAINNGITHSITVDAS